MDAAEPKILIVEDDPQIRMMLQKFLSKRGYRIIVADDGLKGVKSFNEERPNLVLLDTLLPKLMGFDVCDMIKESPEGKSTPVVMMSAVCRAEEFQIVAKSKHRADHFLVKPFQFTEMIDVIEGLLGHGKGTVTKADDDQTIVADPARPFVASPPPIPASPRPATAQPSTAAPPFSSTAGATHDVLDIVDAAPLEEPVELDQSDLTPVIMKAPLAPPGATVKTIPYVAKTPPSPRPAAATEHPQPGRPETGQEHLFDNLEDFEIPELEMNGAQDHERPSSVSVTEAPAEEMIVEFETEETEDTTSSGFSETTPRGAPEIEIEITPTPFRLPLPPSDSEHLIARINDLHPRLGQIDFFSLLGVTRSASAEQIESAYWSIARGLTPDQIASYPPDVQKRARELSTKLSAAFGTLSDPAHRAEYVAQQLRATDTAVPSSQVAPRGAPSSPVPTPESAESHFRRGEKLLKEGAFATALVAFTNALKANPKEPDYYLFLGWAMYQNYRGSGRADMETRAINFVRRALVMNPNLDQGYFFLGRIYHEKGKHDQAKQLYAKAIFINPSHGDALTAMRSLPK